MAFTDGSIQTNIQVNRFGKMMTAYRCSSLTKCHTASFLIHLLRCHFQVDFSIVPAIVMEQKSPL